MESVDYKKKLKHLYRQSATEVSLVDVPRLSYLMIDGEGDPNTSPAFSAAVETLYPFSYAIRSIVKDEQELKYVVMPLEGLWWADDMDTFDVANKDDWKWTLLQMQPDVVTTDIVERAREAVGEKKDLPALSAVRYESLDEGLSAQTLHVGPFSTEGPTVERVHDFIEQEGYTRRGLHHEIYLSDMRRTDPEKLKTIIRQPVSA